MRAYIQKSWSSGFTPSANKRTAEQRYKIPINFDKTGVDYTHKFDQSRNKPVTVVKLKLKKVTNCRSKVCFLI